MNDNLILNTAYWKKIFAVIFTAACFGCAGNKSIGDANIPANDINTQPKAVPRQKTDASPDINEVDKILSQLDQKSRRLRTYEAKIVYIFKQPLLESESLREGMIYYASDEKGSKLRINFMSLRQDNEPVPNYREEYLFDGVYITRVDYKLKNVEYRQLTDSNKPLNAFDLASQYLPIVGFTKTNELKNDFNITQIASKEYYELTLTTKSKSHRKNDYNRIKFWVDKQLSLPSKMEAISPQEDISIIRLMEANVNKKLPEDIFKIEVPADFDKNTVPLEK